jgi:hypothetical protein
MSNIRHRYFDSQGREVSAERATRAGVLQPGFTIRVPSYLRDHARQQFADARSYWDSNKDTLLVTDAARLGGTAGNRPGFRVLDAPLNRQAVRDARAAYIRDLETAYESPQTGFGVHGMRGSQVGDVCTINGAPGRLRSVNGELQCVPDRADARTVDGRRECPDCQGSGELDGEDCPRCDGTGELDDDDSDEDNARAASDGMTLDALQYRRDAAVAPSRNALIEEIANAWRTGK